LQGTHHARKDRDMPDSLFRKEALAVQGQRLAGDLLLSQPLASTTLVLFLSALTFSLLFFLAGNSYARKVSVEGRLVPEHGVIEVQSPLAGQVQAVFVEQGDIVEAGMVLFELALDHTLGSNEALTDALLDGLAKQEINLQRQLILQDETLENLLAGKAQEEVQLQGTLALQRRMLEAAREMADVRQQAVTRARVLLERQLLSSADLEALQMQALQQQQAGEELELQLLQTQGRLQVLASESTNALLQGFQQSERLAAELAELRQRRLRLEAEQGTLVRAPLAGSVGSINVQPGMTVQNQQSVLSLLPAGSRLQAELLVPSAAIGFLEDNQQVKLRFDSFPYQKFGVQVAQVRQVNRSIDQARVGEPTARSVYRSLAELDKQSISAYGREVPLRPGMSFMADVVLEERSLLEWLLEPLYSLRGAP
jgi:membrane fusion protein